MEARHSLAGGSYEARQPVVDGSSLDRRRGNQGLRILFFAPCVIGCLLTCLPGQGTPRVQSDANGWPILDPEAAQQPAVRTPVVSSGSRNQEGRPEDLAGIDSPGRTPLAPIFRQIGFPSALKVQKGAVARFQVTLFDVHGAAVASFEMLHDADLQVPDRDRLVFPSEQRIYGRDGASTFATIRGMSMPTLETEAREELELLGRLLRMPFEFADSSRYMVFPAEPVTHQGRPALRIRIEGRPAESGIVGPVATSEESPERYQLFAPLDSNEPSELRYSLPRTKQERRVLLLEWSALGSVRVPMRRVIVDEEGRKQMELAILRLDVMQELPASQFSPKAVSGVHPR